MVQQLESINVFGAEPKLFTRVGWIAAKPEGGAKISAAR